MFDQRIRLGLSFVFVSLLFSTISSAEEITCGVKTVTIQNGKVVKIKHEDGTVHSRPSISKYWTYDGKSIKHSLMDERVPCGTKPKSRAEIVESLSSQFAENPDLYGLTGEEGKAMKAYAKKLMTSSNSCHLLVDGQKSTQRPGMYYIDCNDRSAVSRRHWISQSDLLQGNLRQASKPIAESVAKEICNKELKARTTNPSTYDPALLTGTSSQIVESLGRNVVEIRFSAKNSFGVEGDYRGRCILESGSVIEATIDEL